MLVPAVGSAGETLPSINMPEFVHLPSNSHLPPRSPHQPSSNHFITKLAALVQSIPSFSIAIVISSALL